MDQAHVAQLLMRHRTALYAYIFASLRNHADAEDVLQNVSLAVVESCNQLADDAGFLPWSLEIARRRILQHRRRGDREHVVDPELLLQLAEAAGRVEQSLPAAAHQTALRTCLEGLPGESRRLIVLRYDGSTAGIGELA